MEIASTKTVSRAFLNRIDAALRDLREADLELPDSSSIRSSKRYIKTDSATACRMISDFFERAFLQMDAEAEPFDADYKLEFENNQSILTAFARLNTKGHVGGTSYGMSARKIGLGDYLIDAEGFFR